jgi:hypothetical protein
VMLLSRIHGHWEFVSSAATLIFIEFVLGFIVLSMKLGVRRTIGVAVVSDCIL